MSLNNAIAWVHCNDPRKTAGELLGITTTEKYWPMPLWVTHGAADFAACVGSIAVSTRPQWFKQFLLDLKSWMPSNVEYIPGFNLHPTKDALFDVEAWKEHLDWIFELSCPRFLIDCEDVFKAGQYPFPDWDNCVVDYDARTHLKPLKERWGAICNAMFDTGKELLLHHPVFMPATDEYPMRGTLTREMVKMLPSNVTLIDPTVAYQEPESERHNAMLECVGAERLMGQMLVAPTDAPYSTGPGKEYHTVEQATAAGDGRCLFTDGQRWCAVAAEMRKAVASAV